ncbi:patatin-like phospholipase family protein [Ulvibacter litoralis]|uniref:NTE family protein n=1 Tax=Ulvibacter litoralis TaxID=227084 RepID=A0A1G7CZI0_9FLAO|nr:patatin-like phospholipase family protein [Ulvibacter litoralis]GHC45470.1 patatin [Ulvibacter litoralis]SDE44679.1 NTE family protein [Ulvibacter litoralis]
MKKALIVIVCFVSGLLYSQEKEVKDLKVGVVLSGGGAKGLAHIGVLKAIEEAGIRVDYVGGTSMGAIVGGLYASGYSAKQLDSIFNVVDFNTLIQDDIPRSAKTFYEKDESEKYTLTLPFDDFQVGFPSGLSKGQNVYNMMSKLMAHVSTVNDFEKLPIPFFCVATNVETGKMVMLNKGYLPRAITASGALPSLFSPVVIDGMLLVDGGVVNNYPIDEVRAKGMDIIIGVDVQDGLKDRTALQSAFDVLVQINNYRTVGDMVEKKGKTDIYIHPNIDDFSVVSFSDGRKIIESGVEASIVYKDKLDSIAKLQLHPPKEEVTFRKRNSFYIDDVGITGNEKYSRAYVLGKLKLKTPSVVTYQDFSDGVNNLSATGNFQDIDYRLVPLEDDKYSIQFTLRENNSSMLLRLGAHYDNLFKSTALVNLTKKRLLTNNDIASFDLMLGDNLRYNFNYYIDKGFYWSIGLNSSYNYFEKDVAIDFVLPELTSEGSNQINRINLEYGDFTNQLYVETLFRRSFLLGGGIEHKFLNYLSETLGIDENNKPRTVFESTNYYSTYGFLKYDTYDNSFFPKKGVFFNGDFHLYMFASGRNDDFTQFSIAKGKIGYAKSFFTDFSAVITSEGGFKIGGGDETQSFDFTLGGFGFKEINNIIPMYGYEALSLRGNTYLKSSLTLDYEIVRKNHINVAVNIAKVGDDLFTSGNWIDGVDYSGYAFGYGLETFFGPIEIKYSYSPERDKGEWYVSGGFRF